MLRWSHLAVAFPATVFAGLLALPMLALALGMNPAAVAAGMRNPSFVDALLLSLRTSLCSTACVLLLGTPLALAIAQLSGRWGRVAEALVALPVALPPTVMGVALLLAFGRNGLIGQTFPSVRLAFSELAVVLAQITVSAPFFVASGVVAIRRVEAEQLWVARSLGASWLKAQVWVALPEAFPGLVAGALLAWSRAVGELGATLIFAGNLPGETQTMPLAILTAFESDVRLAVALALVLSALCGLALVAVALVEPAGRRSR